MFTVANTELNRHLFASHFDEELEICGDDSIVITAVEHPPHRAQFFDLLVGGISEVFDRRSLRYRPEPTNIIIGWNCRSIAVIEKATCGVGSTKDFGVSLCIDKGAATTHRKARNCTSLLRGYSPVFLVDIRDKLFEEKVLIRCLH